MLGRKIDLPHNTEIIPVIGISKISNSTSNCQRYKNIFWSASQNLQEHGKTIKIMDKWYFCLQVTNNFLIFSM